MVSPDHYITLTAVHLWQNGTGWRGGDRPAEGTEAGASGDDLGAPFSLLVLCEERTYSPPAWARWWYCLTAAVRPPGAAPAGRSFPAQYGQASRRQRRLVRRAELRRCTGGLGAVGPQQAAPGIYGALLATIINAYNEG